MTDKPRWFLDVDGPINATNPGVRVWQRHWLEEEVYGYVLRYNPELINHIRDLAKGGIIDVAWCSTWNPHADLLEQAFHLPTMPRAFEDCPPYMAWTEKIRAVEKFDQTTDQLWVWTDDEAPDHGPVYDSLTESGRGLIIRADHYTGITPDDIRRIKEHFGMAGYTMEHDG